MKKCLTILFSLIAMCATAQHFQTLKGFGMEYKRVKVDSTLHIPTFNGAPDLRGSNVNQAAIGLQQIFQKGSQQFIQIQQVAILICGQT